MKYIIGLDIGGTKVEGIVFDGKNVLKSLKIVTPKNLADLKYSLLELVKFLSAEFKIEAVGIGTAGVVDPQKGMWLTSPNIRYVKNLKLADIFKTSGIKQVKIDNDANCFTRAEAVFGYGKGCKNILGVILGTGIGSGLYINGQNFRGSHYSGGEVGQLIIGKDTLEHHYQKAKEKKDFALISHMLAARFADLVNIFDPDCIVLGGSFSQNEEKKFLPQALKLSKKFLINKNLKPKVFVSQMQSAGAIGAALLVK